MPVLSRSPLLFLTLFLTLSSLFAQEEVNPDGNPPGLETSIDWNQIHFGGIAFKQSYKQMDVKSGGIDQIIDYSISSLGLNYGSFSGSRLGFYSDLSLLFPFQSRYEQGSNEANSGVSLDYMGAVGWSLWTGALGFLPFAGFHTQYTFLNRDPLDENQSNHMLSFGLGAGLRILIKVNSRNNIYLGVNGILDTIEFTNASYDSREIQLGRKLSYMVTAGYAYTAPVKKKILHNPDSP